MTLEEAKDIILEIEAKYPVDTWECNDMKVWPLIRIELYMILSNQALNTGGLKTRSVSYILKLLKSIFLFVKSQFHDRKSNSKIGPSQVLFISDGVSFENIDGKWYEKFCDPWISYYKEQNIKTLMLTLENNYFIPRYSSSVFIQLGLNLEVIKNIFLQNFFTSSLELIKLEKFEEFSNDQLLIQNNIRIDLKWLSVKMSKFDLLRKKFARIIDKIQPSVVFIVSYYYDGTMALISECRKRTIRTIDIQHGIQNEFHLSYSNWSKVPEKGYETLPDFFNIWSKSEYSDISNWSNSFKIHTPIITGNIFLQKWFDNSDKLVQDYDDRIKSKLSKSNMTILYSKSPHTESPEMRGDLYQVIYETQYKYNWLIRLHPGMRDLKKSIILELNSYRIFNFEIDFSSEYPLYSLLRNIDLHVTEQSSVVVEAIEFEVFSIITSRYGESLYLDQINKKNAIFAHSTSDIISAIESNIAKKTGQVKTNKTIDFSIYNQFIK
jgi:hypothetical protein